MRTPVRTHWSNTQRRVTSSSSPASSNRQRVNVTPVQLGAPPVDAGEVLPLHLRPGLGRCQVRPR